MTTATDFLKLRLQDVIAITPRVKRFTFVAVKGRTLPAFSGGSHIVLRVQTGATSFRNAYSLIGGVDRTASYQIAVELAGQSRGGSRLLHSLESAGAEVECNYPLNTFPLVSTARHHVFIAGGIGITPFLTFIEDAHVSKTSWELHYAVSSRHSAPFIDHLLSSCAKNCRIYVSDEQNRLDLGSILREQKLGTHLYVCGPDRLITATSKTALGFGWPESSIHYEHFQPVPALGAFTVELARSCRDIHIDSGVSLLEALEEANINVPYGCRAGACGACQTVVLSGIPDHRDHYLTDEEKTSGNFIMPCVSRSFSERLVLDL